MHHGMRADFNKVDEISTQVREFAMNARNADILPNFNGSRPAASSIATSGVTCTAFWKYTHTDDNSDRVGEFAIGTNIALIM